MVKVRLKQDKNGKEYILLGTGYGITKPIPRGTIFPYGIGEKDTQRVVALCNHQGEIVWAESKNVQVVSIDGKYLNEIL